MTAANAAKTIEHFTAEFLTNECRIMFIDDGEFTFDPAVHEFVSDIPAAARGQVSPPLTGKTNALGVLDCDDTVIPTTIGEDDVGAMIYFFDTGDPATSRIITFTDEAPNMPFPQNGLDVTVTQPAGGFSTI